MKRLLCVQIILVAAVLTTVARVHAQAWLTNPDWKIELYDSGYSDNLWDEREGFEGREYLSGEWAAALGYQIGSTPKTPTWVEPNFLYPDWSTNSDFTTTSEITSVGVNSDGFDIYEATVANGDLSVKVTSQMIDTVTGIAQGGVKKSAGGEGGSVTSNRYVLKQEYTITNLSASASVTDLAAFQFAHSLEANVALYDDRAYGTPSAFSAYHYDTTQYGESPWWGMEDEELLIHDQVTFHSDLEPVAYEVGYYGDDDIDNHGWGKPSVGVHLSVEGDSLDGTDYFAPGEKWVSGAQKYSLGTLDPSGQTSYTVLLSVSSETTLIPEPSSLILLVVGVIGVALAMHRRRKK